MTDTPNFKSSEYKKHEIQIKTVRDVYNGTDTAVEHLRQFPKEEINAFIDRKFDTAIDSYPETTVSTISNIIFRKPIDLSGVTSSLVFNWCDEIDFTESINEFAKTLLKNRLIDGKTYLLVDRMSFNEEYVKNAAQQKDEEKRPYFVNILRENLLNYEKDMYGNYVRVSIREYYTEKKGTYGLQTKEQIKVWNNDGLVEVWRDNKLFQSIKTSLKKIPLIEIGRDDNPPLYNQAKLNIQHMNRNSECANYVRVGAAPFLAVFGSIEGDSPKTLGINSGLKFNDKDSSDVKWIEMTGQNYTIINEEINKLVQQMIRIAVDIATDSVIKTATQVEKESMSGESKLTSYATEIEYGINKALKLMQLFTDSPIGENKIKVNKDFNSAILTPEQVKSYTELYIQDIISLDKLLEMLISGEYLPQMEEKELDAEKTKIRNGGGII